MKNKQYYQLLLMGNTADLYIYGDISACPQEGGVSAASLSQQLQALTGVDAINVYINSYGGDVSEGVAIYNALKRHSAKVTTICDGMACSIASVIFMAGDERIMCNPSFLMIHDAWTCAAGNADDFRKAADDLDVITTASVTAYMSHCKLTETELRAKMKAETWLTHTEAVEMGFATGILDEKSAEKPAQNAKKHAFSLFLQAISFEKDENNGEKDDENARKPPQNAPDEPDDGPRRDNEPDDEDDDSNPPDAPEPDAEPERRDENDEKEDEEDETNPAQQWRGFFHALMNL